MRRFVAAAGGQFGALAGDCRYVWDAGWRTGWQRAQGIATAHVEDGQPTVRAYEWLVYLPAQCVRELGGRNDVERNAPVFAQEWVMSGDGPAAALQAASDPHAMSNEVKRQWRAFLDPVLQRAAGYPDLEPSERWEALDLDEHDWSLAQFGENPGGAAERR